MIVQAKFRASKDAWLFAADGTRCQGVTAGEEVNVHYKLFQAALEHGMVPLEPLDEKDIPKKLEKAELPQRELEHNKLIEICNDLIAQGNRKDFTIHGYPKVSVVRAKADFDMTARQVREAFDEAMHRIKISGDDNSERTE